MLTGIIAFFTSNFARMLWGEITAFLTARQDHSQEMERMRLQDELAGREHERNMASVRLQADLGQKEIVLKAQSAVDEIEARAWLSSVGATSAATGIAWVDAWNGVIRPAGATWAILMITVNYAGYIKLDDYGWTLCGAWLGLYVASRDLFKRGK